MTKRNGYFGCVETACCPTIIFFSANTVPLVSPQLNFNKGHFFLLQDVQQTEFQDANCKLL